jgi:flagellar basal-body rod modification protein FlgD
VTTIATNPTTPAPITTTDPTGASTAKKTDEKSEDKVAALGKDDFLKLLVAQLQHQDPMQPTDNAEYMGQLAQFSTLEQITNVGKEMERLRTTSQVDQAVAMIGKNVGYLLEDGTTATGVVDAVAIDDGEIHLKVGENQISPSDVISVRPGATTT